MKLYAMQDPQQKIKSGGQFHSFLYIEKTRNLEQKVCIILIIKCSGRTVN